MDDVGMDRDRLRYALRAARFVCPHTDADGLAAGALALRFRGESASDAVLLGRGQTPFMAGALPEARPAAILDWGVRSFIGPALFVDHHYPEAAPPPDQLVLSGYGADPEVSTSILVSRLLGDDSEPWLAAIGAVGDLGRRAWDLPDLAGVTRTHVNRLVPLVNAPRRAPDGPVRTALAILVDAPSAKEALGDRRTEELVAAKDAWRSAYQATLRVAPEVSDGLALINFSSPFQIHPLVAQAWSGRLAPNVVLAANHGYLEGMVNFAVRGGTGDLRAMLRDALPDETGEFAHGHDRATGGSLTEEAFERLIAELRS